jgi:hypothetical protein
MVQDLEFAVAAALGLELTGELSRAILKHLSAQSSCLLVLDNFETPWEKIETRSKTEEFLALLGEFSQVALLVSVEALVLLH